jgi:hypothetical protein
LNTLLLEHFRDDDRRFALIRTQLASVRATLRVLLVLVAGSGALNYFGPH